MYTPIKPYLWEHAVQRSPHRESARQSPYMRMYPTVLRRVHAHAAVRMYNKLISPTRL